MGSFNSILNSNTIQDVQISQTNQSCTQTASSSVSNISITIINSTTGSISLINSLQIADINCVMSALTTTTANNIIDNVTKNETSLLPFALTASVNNVTNINDIYSFQQALTNQICNQTVSADTSGANLTIIDSVSGNILIGNQTSVSSLSCNLAASTYQQISNQVTNDTKNKTTQSCCGFDICMCIPLLLGIIALPIVAKIATQQRGGQGGGDNQALNTLLEGAVATQLSGLGPKQAAMQ